MKIFKVAAALSVGILLAACAASPKGGESSNRGGSLEAGAARNQDRRLDNLSAELLYRRARASLDNSDFGGAIEAYDNLTTRFPFADVTTQGELERLYALHRTQDPDRALTSADRFLREHPRHPAVDYVQYVKGLVNFSRDDAALSLLPIDESKADVSSLRRAWDDFSTLIQKHPNSRYVGDARQRMVFIRNRLAEHEMHVVDYYVRRGAFVAAAKRAEQVISQYPGTPASYAALDTLQVCYTGAGMLAQADDVRILLAAQTVPANVARTSLNQATPTAPATLVAAAAPEGPPVAAEKPGILARVVNFFAPLDSSQPGAGIEVVIPGGGTSTTDGDKAAAPGESASAAASGESAEKPASNRLEVFFEPYDDAPVVKSPPPLAAPDTTATQP